LSQKVLETSLTRKNPLKILALKPIPLSNGHIIMSFHEFINPKTGKKDIFKKLLHTCPSEAGHLTLIELKHPRPAPLGSDDPGERLMRHGHTTSEHLGTPEMLIYPPYIY